ncbi:phospho-N-acetylmuramoyl-pentapeptide-transferase [Sedimentibacter sp. zth1]|uniref:phospho-N-acetylmuramoyl-pentapeptide- transferase n=1 Tax=Sedimentibacter sp. zth1 TaxID=2816908 RepID=UPI001A91C9F9|nr:phospho-N-acetylmuramoyl-pentapeptide-transferase [Sedimentibacter sp. zth1]QSX06149.1 phospho-N-acetylmuramoyl-pentapeptide-transferase [Sedimentibacter sp. zth1]
MHIDFHILRIILVSFLVVVLLGPIVIPFLKKLKVGQSIREEGPKSHIATKSGTPTMGGIIIVLGIFIATLTSGNYTKEVGACLFAIIGFGLVGFWDDYIKVVLKRNLGFTALQKIIVQLVFALLLSFYGAKYSIDGTKLVIPFTSIYIDLGIFYIPFTTFVILGIVNGVNLTDGLDGLNSGVTLIVMAAFALIANSFSKLNSEYYGVVVVSSAVSGACLGFLRYNAHPAKIFMGDTGSLALGGAVAAVSVVTSLTLVVPIIGGVYLAEVLSDIIQVSHYKRTKKRIFKMAPLHHHFEMCGWKETKIVAVFWFATVILAFIGIYSI